MFRRGKKGLETDFRAGVVTHIVGDRLERVLRPGPNGRERNSHRQHERPKYILRCDCACPIPPHAGSPAHNHPLEDPPGDYKSQLVNSRGVEGRGVKKSRSQKVKKSSALRSFAAQTEAPATAGAKTSYLGAAS